ncbi:hypothetical protein CC80DRAFT_257796 [Byssothecium circinans]|uniref:Uncharacterized protein n=1 Tax=Byssothecium circinans TaxID=147558 RepID=A0A6A5UHB8_9PLEO|nr:hypothetical protein CC80DRAFT_257796 [Byssothecium circinans]
MSRWTWYPASWGRDPPHVLVSTTSRPPEMDSSPRDLLLYGSYFVGLCSIAFVGGFSRFQAGESTRAQRVWTMSWLAFGIFFAPLPSALSTMLQRPFMNVVLTLQLGLAVLTYAVPALGGFVTVSQMIWSYGDCEKLF